MSSSWRFFWFSINPLNNSLGLILISLWSLIPIPHSLGHCWWGSGCHGAAYHAPSRASCRKIPADHIDGDHCRLFLIAAVWTYSLSSQFLFLATSMSMLSQSVTFHALSLQAAQLQQEPPSYFFPDVFETYTPLWSWFEGGFRTSPIRTATFEQYTVAYVSSQRKEKQCDYRPLHAHPGHARVARTALAHDCCAFAGLFHRLGLCALLVRVGQVVRSECEYGTVLLFEDAGGGTGEEVNRMRLHCGKSDLEWFPVSYSHYTGSNKPPCHGMSNILSTYAPLS